MKTVLDFRSRKTGKTERADLHGTFQMIRTLKIASNIKRLIATTKKILLCQILSSRRRFNQFLYDLDFKLKWPLSMIEVGGLDAFFMEAAI